MLNLDKKWLKTAFLGSTAISAAALIGALGFGDPETTEDQKTVDAICESGKPILVVDFFSLKKPDFGTQYPQHNYDVTSDGVPDLHHGDLIEKIARLNGNEVISYGLTGSDKIIANQTMVEALTDILSLIKEEKIPSIGAISLSLGWPLPIQAINERLGGDIGLTVDNAAQKRDAVIERVINLYGENGSGDSAIDYFYKVHQKFLEFQSLGISVVTAAGNDHSKNDTINAYGLLGGITIGSHSSSNVANAASYSNKSSLTTVYRNGGFTMTPMSDGIDMNGDDIPDFLYSDFSKTSPDARKNYRSGNGVTISLATYISGTSYAVPNICSPQKPSGSFAWLHNIMPRK